MKLTIFENNFERRNSYSLSRMLGKSIRFDESKMLSYGGCFSEGIMFEPSEKEKGGIIVFSQEVNAVRLSQNKLINFVKQKLETLKNRLSSKKKIDKIADDNELIGWTVGNYLDGRYKAKNGKMYGEKSMSVEIIGIDTDALIKIAEQLCDAFSQESVLVKDYSTGRVMFVESDNMGESMTESNKGYSSSVYDALDDTYVSEYDGKVDPDYITDNVELFIWNTKEYYDEIFNTRRPAHSVAYSGLLGLFQLNVTDSDVRIRITSEMVKRWFKKHGLDYVAVLKPIVDRIEEERAERKAEKRESIGRKRSSIREGAYGRDCKYLYVLKHGFGPGTIPKGVSVYDYEDRPDGTTLIWVDRPFTQRELNDYDIPSETQLRRYLGSDYDKYFPEV